MLMYFIIHYQEVPFVNMTMHLIREAFKHWGAGKLMVAEASIIKS